MWDLLLKLLRLKVEKKIEEYIEEEKQYEGEPEAAEQPEKIPSPMAQKLSEPSQHEEVKVGKKKKIQKQVTDVSGLSLRSNDGRGGYLLKDSETRRDKKGRATLVNLLPGYFPKADRVYLYGKGRAEDAFFAGYHNPEADGTLRQHWRWHDAPKTMMRKVGKTPELVAVFGNQEKRVKVKNILKRND